MIKSFYKSYVFWLTLAAFIFGVLCRFEWVLWAQGFAQFSWDNELMISTNDGYAFAEGARDMLAGFHQPNDLSFYGSPLSSLSAFIVSITGFKLESVMIYLSTALSPLIVLPLVLVCRDLGVARAGVVAAFIAVVANSYYNRTMAGYYDTDMLTIVLPCFVLWGLVRLVLRLRFGSLIASLAMLANMWWYPSSINLNLAFLALFALFVLIYRRRESEGYFAISLMLIALCAFSEFLRLGLILLLCIAAQIRPELLERRAILWGLCVVCVLLFGFFGGFNPFWFNLKFYIFRDLAESSGQDFYFFNVNQTIMESNTPPLDLFAQRISSSVAVFVASVLGYAIACFRYRALLFALPMLALGFLALKGGLRFTIYAVPVMALGFGFFLDFLALRLGAFLSSKSLRNSRKLKLIFLVILLFSLFVGVWILGDFAKFSLHFWVVAAVFALLCIFVFYFYRAQQWLIFAFASLAIMPSLAHIYVYKPFSVFAASEVRVLNELKNIASREDYALAWWDYGYAIRFYSDVKTLIDGGKHLGADNFAVSLALSSPQSIAANIARLEVEYTERGFNEKRPASSNLGWMMKDYNASDVNEFLFSLNDERFKTPEPSRDVYFVLPDRMHGILSVVSKFSNLDLRDGKSYGDGVFISSESFSRDGDIIRLGGGELVIDLGLGRINYGGQSYDINTYFTTSYENGKLKVSSAWMNSSAELFVIFMNDYGRFLIMDSKSFASSYIQLFVLENYDKKLFEPVILDPAMKVYKVLK